CSWAWSTDTSEGAPPEAVSSGLLPRSITPDCCNATTATATTATTVLRTAVVLERGRREPALPLREEDFFDISGDSNSVLLAPRGGRSCPPSLAHSRNRTRRHPGRGSSGVVQARYEHPRAALQQHVEAGVHALGQSEPSVGLQVH